MTANFKSSEAMDAILPDGFKLGDESLAARHVPVGVGLATLSGQLLYINECGKALLADAGAYVTDGAGVFLRYSSEFAFMHAVARDGCPRYGQVTLSSETKAPRRLICKVSRVSGEEGIPTWLAFAAVEVPELRSSSDSTLDESSNMLVAQSMAKFGSWQMTLLNPADWTQNKMQWSAPMYEIRRAAAGQSDVTGQTFLKAVLPEDRSAVRNAFSSMIHKKESMDVRYRLRLKGGEIRAVLGRAVAQPDERDPEVLRVFGIEMDLNRLLAHQSLPYLKTELMEAIATGLQGMVVAVDAQFRYIYFNDVFRYEIQRRTGREPQLGDNILDELPIDQLKRSLFVNLRKAQNGKRTVEDVNLSSSPLRRQVYEMTFAPIPLGTDERGVVVFGTEITRTTRARRA